MKSLTTSLHKVSKWWYDFRHCNRWQLLTPHQIYHLFTFYQQHSYPLITTIGSSIGSSCPIPALPSALNPMTYNTPLASAYVASAVHPIWQNPSNLIIGNHTSISETGAKTSCGISKQVSVPTLSKHYLRISILKFFELYIVWKFQRENSLLAGGVISAKLGLSCENCC